MNFRNDVIMTIIDAIMFIFVIYSYFKVVESNEVKLRYDLLSKNVDSLKKTINAGLVREGEQIHKHVETKLFLQHILQGMCTMPVTVIGTQVKRSFDIKNGERIVSSRRKMVEGQTKPIRTTQESSLYYYLGDDRLIKREDLITITKNYNINEFEDKLDELALSIESLTM